MSYALYKVVHVAAVIFVFTALGGLLMRALGGGDDDGRGKKLAGLTHGLGLVIVLVSGLGLVVTLGLGFPLWIWLKLLIWLTIGALLAVINRMPRHAAWLWWLVPALGAFAAYLAIYKPTF